MSSREEQLEEALSDAHAWMLASIITCKPLLTGHMHQFQDKHPIYKEAVNNTQERRFGAKVWAEGGEA